MVGSIITTFVKPVIAGTMTVTMALNTIFTGPAGEYAKLQNKAMAIDPAKTATQVSFMLDLEQIAASVGAEGEFDDIEEIPGIYKDGKIDISATVYTISDLDNTKLAISLKEDISEGYVVYIDEDGLAVTPKLVDAALQIYSAIDSEGAQMYEAYTTYFGDNGIYLNWNDMLDVEADEETMSYIELASRYFGVIVDDVVKIITSEENINAFYEIYKPVLDASGKYYYKTDSGYGAKFSGTQLLELYSATFATMNSEDTANKLFDYFLGLVDDVDYIKYIDIAKIVFPEFAGMTLPENVTNAQIALLVRSELESSRADFVEGYTSTDVQAAVDVIEVIITGEDKKDIFEAEEEKQIAAVRPFIENSYLESEICEKDGVIFETEKLSVSDGKVTYCELKVTTGRSKFEDTLPNTEDVVPFEKRVESQELDNKIGFKNAREKGVHHIEILWDSGMTPEEGGVYISYPEFYVYYNTSMADAVKNDPAFLKQDKETQDLILGMYTDEDKEFVLRDSSAEVIDGSVYLPLRQLMENAGYEVSWDGEARKAYVTVDGQQVEMTGIIIKDRTYVKVRDFEKLGATVEYSEDFYRQNAHNDYAKSCVATISFKQDAASEKDPSAFTTEGLINSIFAQKAPLFMTGMIPVDLNDEFSYGTYLGLKTEDVTAIKEAAVSESMIGAQAFSLVVARVNDGVDANAVAAKMKEGINPRKWVCVEADDVKCVVVGDFICFCMISTDFAEDFTAEDAMSAFTKVMNGEAGYIG